MRLFIALACLFAMTAVAVAADPDPVAPPTGKPAVGLPNPEYEGPAVPVPPKPEPKDVAKPIAKPDEKPIEKPIAKPVEKPAAKVVPTLPNPAWEPPVTTPVSPDNPNAAPGACTPQAGTCQPSTTFATPAAPGVPTMMLPGRPTFRPYAGPPRRLVRPRAMMMPY